MKSTLAFALFALSAGCGGHPLDLGGTPGGPNGSMGMKDSGATGWPVPAQRNARSLRIDGAHLYWIADRGDGDVVMQCEKRDCANTLVTFARIVRQPIAGIEIHAGTLYMADPLSIYACSTGDCKTPRYLVTNAEASAFAVHDQFVYWVHRGERTLYACPLSGCQRSNALVQKFDVDGVDVAVDENMLAWIEADTAYPKNPIAVGAIESKSGTSTRIVRQNQAASLALQGGFAYWVTSFTVGTIVRWSGSAEAEPQIVVDNQYFPNFVAPAGEMIFWMNGPTGPGDQRPVQVLGCQVAACASTIEVLGEGLGGGIGTRNKGMPSREMVIDDDAIYWIGDVANEGPAVDGSVLVKGSILRIERRRSG